MRSRTAGFVTAAIMAVGMGGLAACTDEDGDGAGLDEEIEAVDEGLEDGVNQLEEEIDEGTEEVED